MPSSKSGNSTTLLEFECKKKKKKKNLSIKPPESWYPALALCTWLMVDARSMPV